MSQRVTTLCVCVSKFIFKCVWAHYYSPCAAPAICLITFQSPLYCMSGWHTTHTHKHTHLLKVRIASSFFWLHHPCPLLPFSFTSHVSSLFSQLSSFLSRLTLLLSLRLPFISPPPPFSLEKKKNILSPSGKKSGCIRVMRKFKSLKEDCTVACTKLIFSQCKRVCSCVRVYVCGFYSSTHAFTYSLLRNVCLYLPSCQCVFRSSPSCFIFYFLFHFLSVSLLKVKSQL